MNNCTISGNSGYVGGLDASGAPVTLTNTIIAGNAGGDIFAAVVGGTGARRPVFVGHEQPDRHWPPWAHNEWGQGATPSA